MGVGGASVGEVAWPVPISRCRLSKPSDSCRLPGYGYGDGDGDGELEASFAQQERVGGKVPEEEPGQPLNLGSTGCIYIRPDRMFPLHGSLGGSLISALQTAVDHKNSRGNASLSFSLLLFPRP